MKPVEVIERFGDLPFTLELELGSLQMTIGEIFDLKEGSVVRTDHPAGVPFTLLADGVKVAETEVIVVDEAVSIRVNQLSQPKKAAPGFGAD
jgi:flagellar motor switch protein FliN/FliY